MSIVGSNALAGASGQSTGGDGGGGGGGGFQISRSLRFSSGDSAYLDRTPSSAGNRKTWTWSGWVKLCKNKGQVLFHSYSAQSDSGAFFIDYLSSGILRVVGWSTGWRNTTQVFRDFSAWQHVVVAVDTTNATANDRIKVYVNGTQITQFSTLNNPSQNAELAINQAATHRIGNYTDGSNNYDYLDGYLAEVHFVDGQALAASDFGEYDSNSVWQPKEFAGTYGPSVNQSQNWSSGTYSGTTPGSGYEVAKAFNNVGVPGDSFGTGKLWGFYPGSATLTLPAAITLTASSTVELYTWHNTGSSGNITFTCSNGSVAVTPVDNANIASTVVSNPYTTFGASITAITVNSSGSDWTALAGIVIDGKLLVDSSVTITDNSFHLDFSDTSSNAALGKNSAVTDDFTSTVGALTTTQAADFYSVGSNPAGNLFDGSTSTIVYGGYNSTSTNSDLVWTPNGAYTASSSLRVYAGYYSTIYVNGVSKATGGQSSAPGWVTLSHTGSITSIKFENTSNANIVRAAAIEVDGTVVVTTAWTVNNLTAAGVGISNATSYFDTVTWTGDGSSSKAITGLQFQPDLVWIKERSSTSGHGLWNTVVGTSKYLSTESSAAEYTTTTELSSIDSAGFTVGSSGMTNQSSQTYVAWAWDAGDSNTTISAGSLNSSVYDQSKNWSTLVTTSALHSSYNSGGSTSKTGCFDGNRSTSMYSASGPLTITFDSSAFPSSGGPYFVEVETNQRGIKVNGQPSSGYTTNIASNQATYWANNGSVSALTSIEVDQVSNAYGGMCNRIRVNGKILVDTNLTPPNVPTIASTVRANQAAGFSIVSYSSSSNAVTVGHGLNAAPELIILKDRNNAYDWIVITTLLGNTTDYLVLNSSAASANFGADAPTSTTFKPSQSPNSDYLAYCWHGVSGFSKFGSYTSNGSTQTIDCGFKPAFVLIKSSSQGFDWLIYDNKRGNANLRANLTSAEGTQSANTVNFSANGFSVPHDANGSINAASGSTYIYAAFAGTPDGKGIDSLIDTPTNYTADSGNNGGNYPTWNPLSQSSSTFSNGNLQVTTSGSSGYPLETVNFYTPPGTGKWYWEFELSALSGGNYTMVGMLPRDNTYVQGNSNIPTEAAGIQVYIGSTGAVTAASGAATAGTATATFGVGDILGWAFDAENGTVQCYKNGVAQGTQFTNVRTDIGWAFCVTDYANTATATYIINFGQRPFAYTPPTGYVSLCTTNLPDPTIADGSTAMDVALYTANNGNALTVSGLDFSPDLVWIKGRSYTGSHAWYDTVRGATKYLSSNTNGAEGTIAGGVTAFTSDGFTLGNDSEVNYLTNTLVAWAWDAGSSNTSISAGGLNSSVYNQSQVWSTAGTITNDDSSNNTGIDKAFDGSLDENAQHFWFPQNGTTSRYTFPSVQTGTKFELYMEVSITNTNFSVNGQQSSNVPASTLSGRWVDVTDAVTASGLGGLSYIEISYAANQYSQYIFAIRIDGKMYIDSGVSVTNVPTIASTVRANPSAGFSIVSYTGNSTSGSTVGHGLNAKPALIIVKNREASEAWCVYSESLGATQYLFLNVNNAASTSSALWNDTEPTTSAFTLGNYNGTNNGDDFVAYCFAPVENYSAFGKFSGNSSTDGPFQYCGFKPRFLLLKGITQARNWIILDTERDAGNVGDSYLHPDSNGAESTYAIADILSNGFKMRYNGGLANQTGEDYIWAAFASHPFKTARAR